MTRLADPLAEFRMPRSSGDDPLAEFRMPAEDDPLSEFRVRPAAANKLSLRENPTGDDYRELAKQLELRDDPRGAIRGSAPYRAVEQGLSSLRSSVESAAAGALSAAAGAVGADETSETLAKTRRGLQNRSKVDAAVQSELDKRGLLGEKITSWVRGGGAAVTESVAAGALGGLPALAAYYGGSTFDRTLHDTGSPAEAAAHGAIEGAATLFGGKLLGAGTGKLAQSIGGRAAAHVATKNPVGHLVKEAAKGMGGEVAEEVATEASHYLADVAMGREKWNKDELTRRVVSVIGPSAVAGGFARGLSAAMEKRQKQLPEVAKAMEAADKYRADNEDTSAAEQPLSQKEFAAVTGIKKTSEAFREAFREGLKPAPEVEQAAAPTGEKTVTIPPKLPAEIAEQSQSLNVSPAATDTVDMSQDQTVDDISQPEADTLTSARREDIDADRAVFEQAEIPDAERRSWSVDLAAAREADIPAQAINLAKTILDTPRALSSTETAGFVEKAVQLKGKHADLLKQIADAPTSEKASNLAHELEAVEADFDTLSTALRVSGTEKGRALAAQKLTLNQDLSLITLLARAKAVKKGAVSDSERRVLKSAADKAARIQERLELKLADEKTILEYVKDGIVPPAKQRAQKTVTKEIAQLQYELHKVRTEIADRIADMKPKTWTQKGLGAAGETIDFSRALITSIDFPVLRQGKFMAMSHPIMTARNVPLMLKAFMSDKAAHEIRESIENHPNAARHRRADLFRHKPGVTKLSEREETYKSKWGDKFFLTRMSQRAYQTFLDKLRVDAFEAMADPASADDHSTLNADRVIANFVNVATGRGSLWFAERASGAMSQLFMAPRYTTSRLQTLALQPLWGGPLEGTGRARLKIAEEYVKFLAGIAAYYSLLWMAFGQDDDFPFNIELNPTSADFGKAVIGNTRIDPLAGLSQMTRFIARTFSGYTKDKEGNVKVMSPSEQSSDLGRFLRTKASPIMAQAINWKTGQTFDKSEYSLRTAEGWRTVGEEMVMPMLLRDMDKVMKDQGIPRGTALFLLQLAGEGVQVYEDEKNNDERRGL